MESDPHKICATWTFATLSWKVKTPKANLKKKNHDLAFKNVI